MTEKEITDILDTYFNRESPPKFVNVSRVPLICQDIKTIKDSILELKRSVESKEEDHEKRIRDNEIFRQQASGIGKFTNILWGVVVVVAGWVMWFFGQK